MKIFCLLKVKKIMSVPEPVPVKKLVPYRVPGCVVPARTDTVFFLWIPVPLNRSMVKLSNYVAITRHIAKWRSYSWSPLKKFCNFGKKIGDLNTTPLLEFEFCLKLLRRNNFWDFSLEKIHLIWFLIFYLLNQINGFFTFLMSPQAILGQKSSRHISKSSLQLTWRQIDDENTWCQRIDACQVYSLDSNFSEYKLFRIQIPP